MYELISTICIIGMPGSGKSTLARQMAAEFQLPVIDLDDSIELDLKMPIPEFWKAQGEGLFRSFERFHLLKVFSGGPVILSTGGGTPGFFDNLRLIKSFSFSIYLKSDFPMLTEQMMNGSHPAFDIDLDLNEQWNSILRRRKKNYEQADVIQDAYTIEPNVFEAVSKICIDQKIIIRN